MFDHDYKNYPELTNEQLEVMQFSSPHIQIISDFMAKVVKVHDGDTVTLRTDFRDFDFPLRLINIDAPEMSEGGEGARDWLKSKLLNQEVAIGIDSLNRVGKYGRLLGDVYYNGMSMSEEMLQLGIVKPFGTKKEGQPPSIYKMFNLKQWGL